jgi:hypothetical protein
MWLLGWQSHATWYRKLWIMQPNILEYRPVNYGFKRGVVRALLVVKIGLGWN